MKNFLLLLLAAFSFNFISCDSKTTSEVGAAADISADDIENSTAATDQAETTTTIIDSTAVINADTTEDN